MAIMSLRFLVGHKKKIRLVLIGNGGKNSEHFNHATMAAFGVYGLIQYVLNSPNLSANFVEGILTNYVNESTLNDQNLEFVNINLNGHRGLRTTDPSAKNMAELMEFGDAMFRANKSTIDKLIQDVEISPEQELHSS